MTKSRHVAPPRRYWTNYELAVMRATYADTPTKQIAAQLGRSEKMVYSKAKNLGLRKSEAYLASEAACRLRQGDAVGYNHRFKRGGAPWNKGLKGATGTHPRTVAHHFKPGNRPHTWCPWAARASPTVATCNVEVTTAEKAQHEGTAQPAVGIRLDRHVRRGWLMLNGWAGRTDHRCIVLGETPKRYRVALLHETRLPSRRTALPGQPLLVPRCAVRLDTVAPNCDRAGCPTGGDGPCAQCEREYGA